MAKKADKNNTKTSQKSQKTTKSTAKGTVISEGKTASNEKSKKPLVSTKKKIGLTVYFTVVGTLALVMGAQILLADVYSTPSTQQGGTYNTPQTQSTEIENNQNDDNYSGIYKKVDNKEQNQNNTNNGNQNNNLNNENDQYEIEPNQNNNNTNLNNNYSNYNQNNTNNQVCENGICYPINNQ